MTTAAGAADVEQVQHAAQLADVAAGEHDRLRSPAGCRRTSSRWWAIASRSCGRQASIEVALRARGSGRGAARRAAGPPRARRRARRPASAAGLPCLRHAVRRAQRVVELDQVERAQLGERRVVLALGVGVLPVALVHVEPAGSAARGSPCVPPSSSSSSASSDSRSCQPAVTVGDGPARRQVARRRAARSAAVAARAA